MISFQGPEVHYFYKDLCSYKATVFLSSIQLPKSFFYKWIHFFLLGTLFRWIPDSNIANKNIFQEFLNVS